MAARSESYSGLMHAGAGTVLFVAQLSAVIPGLLPTLVLIGVIAAVVLVPVLALMVVAAVLATPALLGRLLVNRIRGRA
jgi:hypothetical protein